MGTLRKIKRGMQSPSPLTRRQLEPIYNRGFDDGAKAQREADIKYVVQLMEDVEDIPGVGKVTAEKLREYFKIKLEGGN
ncbi:hypothetical protein [Bacillus sp. B15-48]|uniref:hypothetical protein n=1 Tax=Bacillus sp. B15-48 TaxID=1548601 RepID=UPI00193EEEA4|nr:hypothetical protein [Bacillus sp. B15-48]MBM4762731.1 hypothetical protein [Bacillus sp. B15-48]